MGTAALFQGVDEKLRKVLIWRHMAIADKHPAHTPPLATFSTG